MPRVLCFGSLNIDYVYQVDHFVQGGETISSKTLNVYSGGKGLNQSVALGKAGCEVYHAGQIGKDGLFLLDVLKEAGVDITKIKVSDTLRSGNAIIQNDAQGDNCIILYPGANCAMTEEMVDEVLLDFSEGDYLVLQNEINKIEEIVKKASEKGMVIVLNPSPVNECLTPEILGRADWMLLNEIEAMQLTGCQRADAEEMSASLRKAFPNTRFVLTMGTEGSWYIDEEKILRQEIFPVKTVDTTAAGDTYTGYFVSGLIHGWELGKCMRAAARAASIAVSRPGAAPSIPLLDEVLGELRA